MTFLEEIALRQTVFWSGLSISIIAAILYAVLACYRPPSWWKTVLKAVPVLALIVAGGAQFAAPAVLVALVLSWIGDVALSRNGERAFLIGLISFAGAHIAYVFLFLSLGTGALVSIGAAVVVLLALSTERWLTPYCDNLRWPVRGYVAIIAAMAICALTLDGRDIAVWGAFLFLASDLLLAVHLFRLQPTSRLNVPISIALWVLYMAAQIAILLGAGFSKPILGF